MKGRPAENRTFVRWLHIHYLVALSTVAIGNFPTAGDGGRDWPLNNARTYQAVPLVTRSPSAASMARVGTSATVATSSPSAISSTATSRISRMNRASSTG